MKTLVSPVRLYFTADRKHVVGEGDPKAAFLFVGAGGKLSEADVVKFGLEHLFKEGFQEQDAERQAAEAKRVEDDRAAKAKADGEAADARRAERDEKAGRKGAKPPK